MPFTAFPLFNSRSRNADALESSHYAGQSADLAWQLILNALGVVVRFLPHRLELVHTTQIMRVTHISFFLPHRLSTSHSDRCYISARFCCHS